MKKTKAFYLVAVLAVSVLLLFAVNVRAVSEEARRHMTRGMAAVEMAKSPEDYEAAILEFQEAARLAPTWPVPHYNLGLVQEKAGKLREAVASLKQYLRLAPNAPDAAKIKEYIYKLEYKAEQVLTIPEIIDVLVSFSCGEKCTQGATWSITGNCRCEAPELNIYFCKFSREGSDTVKVGLVFLHSYHPPRIIYQTLKVTGPVLKYTTKVSICTSEADERSWDSLSGFKGTCYGVAEQEVEVVSKGLVKVKMKMPDGTILTCTFRKQ